MRLAVAFGLIFLDCAARFPGSIHDARMLRATKLYEDAEANISLRKTIKIEINEIN